MSYKLLDAEFEKIKWYWWWLCTTQSKIRWEQLVTGGLVHVSRIKDWLKQWLTIKLSKMKNETCLLLVQKWDDFYRRMQLIFRKELLILNCSKVHHMLTFMSPDAKFQMTKCYLQHLHITESKRNKGRHQVVSESRVFKKWKRKNTGMLNKIQYCHWQ